MAAAYQAPRVRRLDLLLNTLAWVAIIFMVCLPALWVGKGDVGNLMRLVPEGAWGAVLWAAATGAILLYIGGAMRGRMPDHLDTGLPLRVVLGAVMAWDIVAALWTDNYFTSTIVLFTVFWVLALTIVPRWWLQQARLGHSVSYPASLMPAAIVVMLLVLFGLPSGRSIAGTHPNLIGGALVAGMACCLVAQRRLNLIVFGLSIGICILVQARGAVLFMAALAGFWTLMSLFKNNSIAGQNRRRFGFLLLAFVGMLMVFGIALADLFLQLANDYFAYSDRHRGIGSGLTGRTDMWIEGLRLGVERPFMGDTYWYRGTEGVGHNVVVGTLFKYGLIPGGMIVLAVVYRIIKIVLAALRDPNNLTLHAIAAFLMALIPYSMLEYWPMNFSKPVSFVIFVFLLYPIPRVSKKPVQQFRYA